MEEWEKGVQTQRMVFTDPYVGAERFLCYFLVIVGHHGVVNVRVVHLVLRLVLLGQQPRLVHLPIMRLSQQVPPPALQRHSDLIQGTSTVHSFDI